MEHAAPDIEPWRALVVSERSPLHIECRISETGIATVAFPALQCLISWGTDTSYTDAIGALNRAADELRRAWIERGSPFGP
jgi:hypothetical protein